MAVLNSRASSRPAGITFPQPLPSACQLNAVFLSTDSPYDIRPGSSYDVGHDRSYRIRLDRA